MPPSQSTGQRALRWYVRSVSAAGIATLGTMTTLAIGSGSFPRATDATVFLLAIVGTQLPLVTVRRRQGADEASVADSFAFAAVLLFSPAFAALGMAAGSIVADLRRRKPFHRLVFNVAQYSLSVAAAGTIVAAWDGRFGATIGPRHLAAGAAAGIVFFAVNWVLVGVAVALSQRSRIVDFLFTDISVGLWDSLSTLTQGVLAALVYPRAGWALALFLPASHTIHLARRRYQALRTQAREAMQTLAAVIDDRDPTTSQHSTRVARYSVAVGTELGLTERAIDELEKAGLVHDLGKVAVPDAILMKPGPLTPAEMAAMHTHPVSGADILGHLEIYETVTQLVRHHHERWDGKGYPDHLAGQDIPLGSRIISVVDAFDAMTTVRPYRRPVALEEALEELERMCGTQFDPSVVRVFCRIVRRAPDAFRVADRGVNVVPLYASGGGGGAHAHAHE